MPWKNGLGSTLELAIHPSRREGLADFTWRVSIATVPNDGPFSSFPGYDRIILVIDGHGMALSHTPEGGTARIGALEPYAFRGDWSTHCTLIDGPVHDFNVMTRRTEASSTVTVLNPGMEPTERALTGSSQLLYCLSGRCRVTLPRRATDFVVAAHEALRVDVEGESRLEGDVALGEQGECGRGIAERELPERGSDIGRAEYMMVTGEPGSIAVLVSIAAASGCCRRDVLEGNEL
jgi:hypothetical protein